MEEFRSINESGEESVAKKKPKKGMVILAVLVGVFFLACAIFYIVVAVKSESIPDLEISDTEMSVVGNDYLGYYSVTIKGVAKNATNKNYSYASVEFSVYDEAGNNLGTAWANINNLKSGDTWRFEAVLLSVPETCPVSYTLVKIDCL